MAPPFAGVHTDTSWPVTERMNCWHAALAELQAAVNEMPSTGICEAIGCVFTRWMNCQQTDRHGSADVGAGACVAALSAAMLTAGQLFFAGASACGCGILAAEALRDCLQSSMWRSSGQQASADIEQYLAGGEGRNSQCHGWAARLFCTLPHGHGRGPVNGHSAHSPAWHTAWHRCLPQLSSRPHGLAQRKSPAAQGTSAVSAPQAHVCLL